MNSSSAATLPLIAPGQVWPQLAADRQGRAVQLLAQLAYRLATSQAVAPAQEDRHAVRSVHHPA